MGRKNRKVRMRNTPRAAQRQPKPQRTHSAQSDARQHWTSEHETSRVQLTRSAKPLENLASDQ